MKNSIFLFALLASFTIVFAVDASILEGQKLVESKASCNALTADQLEKIGDYYMEQMHPGVAHEMMDRMMGGDGSESLRQVHINIAKRLYCNEDVYVGYGVAGTGRGMMGTSYGSRGFSGPGMMGYGTSTGYGYGMMGYGNSFFGGWSIFDILLLILIIGLIVLVYLHIWRKAKEQKPKR
ncbi:MAG: hypothetical protein AABY04_04260 [Candidatus Micrarchaeota archaeon]